MFQCSTAKVEQNKSDLIQFIYICFESETQIDLYFIPFACLLFMSNEKFHHYAAYYFKYLNYHINGERLFLFSIRVDGNKIDFATRRDFQLFSSPKKTSVK